MPTLADQLRAMAEPVLAEAETNPMSQGMFRDEAGHHRPVDGPFLVWRSRGKPHAPGAPAASATPSITATGTGMHQDADVLLWSALTDPSLNVDAALAELRGTPRERTDSDAGALFPHRGRTPIEVWTETELSCLHALWWLARERGRDDWAALVAEVAAWHVENLQPDNATNHPWAVHVFLLMSEREADTDLATNAQLYAQTLVHNCRVSMGRPDLLSAHILLDAAEALDSA